MQLRTAWVSDLDGLTLLSIEPDAFRKLYEQSILARHERFMEVRVNKEKDDEEIKSFLFKAALWVLGAIIVFAILR